MPGVLPVLLVVGEAMAMSSGQGPAAPALPAAGQALRPAMATAPAAPVVLACADAPRPVCDALSAAIAERTGRAPEADPAPPGALRIELRMTRVSDRFLEGYLLWGRTGETPVAGPKLELSIMDATIRPASYRQFADGLLRVTGLPF